MHIRWKFRDQPSEDFSVKLVFHPKSNWEPPLGHAGLKLYLNQLVNEIFNCLPNDFVHI